MIRFHFYNNIQWWVFRYLKVRLNIISLDKTQWVTFHFNDEHLKLMEVVTIHFSYRILLVPKFYDLFSIGF